MAEVKPFVTGVAYTEQDRGRSPGYWQIKVMDPVLSASEYPTGALVVDEQGRVVNVIASAARTADVTTNPVYSRGATGLTATLVVTASAATPSITFAIQAYEPASATWVTLLTSAAITGASTNTITVSPQIATSANVSLNRIIPDTVRIFVDHSDTDSITYSVGLDWS